MKEIVIKPDQMAVASGETMLKSLALGSSLAVCLYDRKAGIGGMVHTLLPQRPHAGNPEKEKLRWADTAVYELCEAMEKAGASRPDMRAKLAGGARIFFFSDQEEGGIGEKNVLSARQALQKLEVPIESEDTGESYGRSIYFYVKDGSVEIETMTRSRYRI